MISDLINVYIYLKVGCSKKWSQALISGTHCQEKKQWAQTGTRGFTWTWGRIYWWCWSTDTGGPEGLWNVLLGDLKKLFGHGPGLSGGWTRWPTELSSILNHSAILNLSKSLGFIQRISVQLAILKHFRFHFSYKEMFIQKCYSTLLIINPSRLVCKKEACFLNLLCTLLSSFNLIYQVNRVYHKWETKATESYLHQNNFIIAHEA